MTKRKYNSPEIDSIIIDAEISMILMSEGSPPVGPPEGGKVANEPATNNTSSFEHNPFGTEE
ncbi:hypothetical protein [Saccharicrinis aurantiacus]|uniref:hypothetical protein n=1 Tax=Saccharicrinis aurantiacus TaxID=1849719 RepID=UPI0024908114|nr:hypothetical protein [Saccharicrinis aurantiacus]